MPTILIFDETTAGAKTEVMTLDNLNACITARELLRMRIYQEVQDYNRNVRDYNKTKRELFRGLVQPTGATAGLNGYTLSGRREVDWKEQFDKAADAFDKNGFLLLVNGRQVESLDETIVVTADTQASFIKLVPLVGG